MTVEEAISILENAAFLATKTDFQSICEALEIVKKALKKQDFPTQMSGTSGEDLIRRQDALDILDDFADQTLEVQHGIYERARKRMCEL